MKQVCMQYGMSGIPFTSTKVASAALTSCLPSLHQQYQQEHLEAIWQTESQSSSEF